MAVMKVSRVIFAVTLIAIGLFGIVAGDFGAM
jgi:hypothetical protein